MIHVVRYFRFLIPLIFTSWYAIAYHEGNVVWRFRSLDHSLTRIKFVRQLIYALNVD